MPRNELLCDKEKPSYDPIIRWIGTYDANVERVNAIIRKHWHILRADKDLKQILTPYPSITYRRGKNLMDILVHSHLKTSSGSGSEWLKSNITGFFPCGNCDFCTVMPKRKQFTNPYDHKMYDIRQFLNCKSKGVLYGAMCDCPKIYIGKTTQELRRRVSKHLSTIRTQADTPLVRHIRDTHKGDHSGLVFWGITKPKLGPRGGNLDNLLLKIEAQWIYRLHSLSPIGLNEGFSFSAFLE